VSTENKEKVRDILVDLANRLGYDVELESLMEGHDPDTDADGNVVMNKKGVPEGLPAGDINYLTKKIRVRAGKGLNGQIATMVHELCHALAFGNLSLNVLGEQYAEGFCESATLFITRALGIDRDRQCGSRLAGYGYFYQEDEGTVIVTPLETKMVGSAIKFILNEVENGL
jgi:hypothetical protein